MTDLNRHLQSGFDELRMSESEKRAMRGSLEAHMSAYPLGGMKSPYTWVSFTHMRSLVLVPVLILMLGSGTAFAAQGALPGDTLYPIKIHVNEAVAGALAVSDAAKASYNTEAAAERLKEAQTLAAQNKLSASTTDELTQNYEAHAALAVAYADKVDTSDAAKGAELRANLATLQAEGTVLATVAGKDGSEETKHNAVALAIRAGAAAPEDDSTPVHASATLAIAMAAPASTPAPKAFAVQTLSVSATAQDGGSSRKGASLEASASQVSAKAIAALQSQATAQLASLRDLARAQTLDASTTAALQIRLDDLQSLIDSARDASGTDALHLYQRALSQGTVLKTFLSASKKFNLDILSPLLHLQSAIHSEDSSSYEDHRDWHGDDTSVSTPLPESPTAVTGSATSSTGADSGGVSSDSGGGASGSSGSGGAVVQEVIQTVTNGLHL